MPDVFVNYRTGDEESAATMIARELARRFGDERIFFASNSIEPGRRFPVELVTAVEECEALAYEVRFLGGARVPRELYDAPAHW